jgi:hypothetical protein
MSRLQDGIEFAQPQTKRAQGAAAERGARRYTIARNRAERNRERLVFRPAPYSPEFRREVVSLLKSNGKTVPQLAAELGGLAAVAAQLEPPDPRRRAARRA